jgi:sulfotransferase 6B1
MCAKQVGKGLPSFFMNSVPKSGTNLLIQILAGLPDVSHNPKDTFFDPHDFQGSFYRLGNIPNKQFGVGHIYFSPEWSFLLNGLGMKQIFLFRDLRDVVVSYSHFVVEKPQYHRLERLREYLLTETKTEKERLLALIKGVQTDHFQYPSLGEWFLPFGGWLRDDNTLSITFEELVQNEDSNRQVLTQIIQFLFEGETEKLTTVEMVESMRANIDPATSGTFRKGKIGSWVDEFDEEVKAAFKAEAGELLITTGYEHDLNW